MEETTAVVFALEGSFEYHNGKIRRWGSSQMEIETATALDKGDHIVIKLVDFCAVFHSRVQWIKKGGETHRVGVVHLG
jgi:hypothetical protein